MTTYVLKSTRNRSWSKRRWYLVHLNFDGEVVTVHQGLKSEAIEFETPRQAFATKKLLAAYDEDGADHYAVVRRS